MRDGRWESPAGGLLLVACGAALWGTDTALRAPLLAVMPATAIVIAQNLLLAGYAVPALLAARRALARLRPRGWLALLGVAWGSAGLGMVLFTEALRHGHPTTVVLLANAQPLVAVLLAVLVLGERLPRHYWPCFGVAVAGAYLLSFGTLRPLWALGPEQAVAAGLAAGAVALWGGATVLGRLLLRQLSFATLTAARYFLALPFLAALALARGELAPVLTGLAEQPLRLLLLAALPGLAGMLLYYRGLRHAPATHATLGELAYPASALALNWLLLGAAISPAQGVGFLLLWAAVTALTWLPTAPPAPAPAVAPAS